MCINDTILFRRRGKYGWSPTSVAAEDSQSSTVYNCLYKNAGILIMQKSISFLVPRVEFGVEE